MTTYIFKRLLLMIPTMLLIILVSFLVLNFAPGRPGGQQMSAEGTEAVQSTEARESYRIFKEQFNFDKPVILNFRYGLSQSEVGEELQILADSYKPICPQDGDGPEGCLPAEQRPPSGEIIAAQEHLEDWGEYIVPELYEVAADEDVELAVRVLALNQLATNAKLRLKNEYGKDQSKAEQAFNKEASAVNRTIEQWTVGADATAAEIDAVLADNWKPWLDEHGERFEYTAGEKLAVTFVDTRFAKYLGNILTLDFGVSHLDKEPVLTTIWERVKVSMVLSFLAIFLAYIISVPLGVWSAYKQHTLADQVVTALLFMLYSLPSFFTAILLLEWLTVGEPFDWFPTGGFVGDGYEQMTTLEYFKSVGWHMVLPVFCLTYGGLASLSRYARSGLLDVIRADYIRTARAKGLSEPMVIIKHAVRNGMIPILTLLGTLLPALIGGSVIIEFIFNIPGMGLYLLDSIFQRDYNAIMGVLVISAFLTLVGILISDISYAIVDPRISFD